MVLLEVEGDDGPARQLDRFREHEHRLSRHGFGGSGPMSMPQAVSSLPSIAKVIGPVTRFRLLWSSKIASSGVSGGLTSAVALEILTLDRFPFSVSRPSLDLNLRQSAPFP